MISNIDATVKFTGSHPADVGSHINTLKELNVEYDHEYIEDV
jgi:hypothetical protein